MSVITSPRRGRRDPGNSDEGQAEFLRACGITDENEIKRLISSAKAQTNKTPMPKPAEQKVANTSPMNTNSNRASVEQKTEENIPVEVEKLFNQLDLGKTPEEIVKEYAAQGTQQPARNNNSSPVEEKVADVKPIESSQNDLESMIQMILDSDLPEYDKKRTISSLKAQMNQAPMTTNSVVEEEKTASTNSEPASVEDDIKSYEAHMNSLGDLSEDKREKSMILATVEKLKRAREAGVSSINSEQEQNYYMLPPRQRQRHLWHLLWNTVWLRRFRSWKAF